jgi:predicted TIM-barrel fold metal-dependent hydrolase
MPVDVHAHCFPAKYLERLERRGDASARSLAALGAGDTPDELAARLDAMDRAGVDMQVLSISGQGWDPDDASEASSTTRLANDLLGDIVGRYPDRFAAFAALPLPNLDPAAAELERVLGLPGFLGVCVPSSIRGRSIADQEFEPLFDELDWRATVLFIHPVGRGAESPLVVDRGLEWPIGATIEDTIVVTQLLARAIPGRFPQVRIVNAHLGGALPMLGARLDALLPRVAPDMAERPSLAARRMWYDTVCHAHGPALLAGVSAFGADRLVLGSDYPFVRGDAYDAAVRFVSGAGLPATDVQAILESNAATVLEGQAGPPVGVRSADSAPARRR